MKSKTKILLGSALTVAMCASLITGSTLALFTSESKTNIAVTSGKVDVEANITALYTYSNATEDIPATSIDEWQAATAEGDGFTGTFAMGGKAVYTVEDGAGNLSLTNILPGDAAKFTFSVVNNSTVSIRYQVRVVVGEEGSTDENDAFPDAQLSSALELTFNGGTIKGFHEAATAWSEPVTGTDDGMTQDLIIRLPKDAGNEYQTKKCEIALSVVAVQGNADTSHYCEINGGHFYDDSTGNCIYCGAANPFAAHHIESGDTYTVTGVDTGVTDVVIPAEINGKPVKIEGGAFANNPDLKSVKIEGDITELPAKQQSGYPRQLGLFYGCTSLTSVELPEGLKTIGAYAFSGCKNLKDINIPSSVTEIGDDAFESTAIESVTFQEGMEIGYRVFRNCNHLKEVSFEGDATIMFNSNIFDGCSQIERYNVPDLKFWINHGTELYGLSGASTILSNGAKIFVGGELLEGEYKITAETPGKAFSSPFYGYKYITSVRIEEKIDANKFTKAFMKCDGLQNVTVAAEVTEISTSMFEDCNNLTEVTFDKGCTVTVMENAFYACDKLAKCNFDGVIELRNGAFGGCAFDRVVIPGTCKVVGTANGGTYGVFDSCSKLKYFEMQEGVETLGMFALYKCTALETLVVPSSLVSVSTVSRESRHSDLLGYLHDAKYGVQGGYVAPRPGTGKNVTVYFHGTKEQLMEKEWYNVEANAHNYQLHGEDAEKKYCKDEDVDWFYLSDVSITGQEDKYWNYNEEGVPTPWEEA